MQTPRPATARRHETRVKHVVGSNGAPFQARFPYVHRLELRKICNVVALCA